MNHQISSTIISRMDSRATARVSGKAWKPLRDAFLRLSQILLDAAPDSTSQLTTIYVKYETASSDGRRPFAVVWLKRSSELVVGIALPEDFSHPSLIDPPPGFNYPLLSRFLVVRPGAALPPELAEWARLACLVVSRA